MSDWLHSSLRFSWVINYPQLNVLKEYTRLERWFRDEHHITCGLSPKPPEISPEKPDVIAVPITPRFLRWEGGRDWILPETVPEPGRPGSEQRKPISNKVDVKDRYPSLSCDFQHVQYGSPQSCIHIYIPVHVCTHTCFLVTILRLG